MTTITEQRRLEIIEKIRACFSRSDTSRGASQAEAETAVKMAKRLMAEYNLSQADVELDSGTTDATGTIVEEGGLDHYKNIEAYEIILTQVCENLFNVKPLVSTKWDKETGKRRKYMVFVGYETDVALAKEVYSILRADVNALEKQLGAKVSKEDKYDYRLGVVHTLKARAKEMADGLTKEQMSKCTALVVVKDGAISEWMKNQYGNLTTSKVRTKMSMAYEAGRMDGKHISMNFSKKLK